MENKRNCFLYEECNHRDCNEDFCMRLYKLDYLYNLALLSQQQRKHLDLVVDEDGTDVEEFQNLKSIENNILRFVENGDNLYIHSRICGCGKTSWALRMIQAYFNKIWNPSGLVCRALFINVPRFLIELKDNISSKSEYITHIKENVLNCDLVVWDEIGSKGLSSFEHENILNLLNARLDMGKANIYTSNLTNEELHESVGDRLYSRIVNNSIDIQLNGADKRGINYGM